MAIEIERKFLLTDNSWQNDIKSSTVIAQGYLSSVKERTVRIRIKGKQAFLTVKGETVNTSRQEFEYEIPMAEGKAMLALCERPLIKKTRHEVFVAGNLWEIDVFEEENKGLLVAEIELEEETTPFRKPSWLGEEVSDDPRYYNASLIKHPYTSW